MPGAPGARRGSTCLLRVPGGGGARTGAGRQIGFLAMGGGGAQALLPWCRPAEEGRPGRLLCRPGSPVGTESCFIWGSGAEFPGMHRAGRRGAAPCGRQGCLGHTGPRQATGQLGARRAEAGPEGRGHPWSPGPGTPAGWLPAGGCPVPCGAWERLARPVPAAVRPPGRLGPWC